MNVTQKVRWIWKPLAWLACLLPLLLIGLRIAGIGESLGANPVEKLQDHFGQWGLRFIMITLAVTPLRQISGWASLARFRRLFGLFAFFYICLHFLVWLTLDQELSMTAIVEDIVERPYITIGMVALVILVAMAVTSTAGMRRRLGRSWQKLHNGIYVVALLGVWHYWWQVKKDFSEPLIYAAILALLLGYRWWRRSQRYVPIPQAASR